MISLKKRLSQFRKIKSFFHGTKWLVREIFQPFLTNGVKASVKKRFSHIKAIATFSSRFSFVSNVKSLCGFMKRLHHLQGRFDLSCQAASRELFVSFSFRLILSGFSFRDSPLNTPVLQLFLIKNTTKSEQLSIDVTNQTYSVSKLDIKARLNVFLLVVSLVERTTLLFQYFITTFCSALTIHFHLNFKYLHFEKMLHLCTNCHSRSK